MMENEWLSGMYCSGSQETLRCWERELKGGVFNPQEGADSCTREALIAWSSSQPDA